VQEADTHHEWTNDDIGSWMKVQTPSLAPGPVISVAQQTLSGTPSQADPFDASAAVESKATIKALIPSDRRRIVDHLDANRDQIPPEIDRPMLARLRNRLGRDLTDAERKRYRTIFAAELRAATRTTQE
jgi:hypothetical protein